MALVYDDMEERFLKMKNMKMVSLAKNEFKKMKVASNRVRIKEDILTSVEKNPHLIKIFSIEKLNELDTMYDEIIEKNDRKIKQLRRETE